MEALSAFAEHEGWMTGHNDDIIAKADSMSEGFSDAKSRLKVQEHQDEDMED